MLFRLIVAFALVSLPIAAEAACGLGVAGQTRTVAIPGTARTVQMHRPAGAGEGPLPLVMLFHGSGGHGAGILGASKLAATADARGFIVVAPDAGIALKTGFAWNIPGVPTIAGTIPTVSDPDDVAFVGTVIDALASHGCVDRTRVYATGLSGGGRMTSWLGCVSSDRFAAIAPVVGLRAGNPSKQDPSSPDPATCRPSRPMPVMSFAGAEDRTNPPGGGGAGYWSYSQDAALARWAELNGCTVGPIEESAAPWSAHRYSGCRDRADAVSYLIAGRGHEWVADNDFMWRFFERFRR